MDDTKDFGTPKKVADKTVNLTIDGMSVTVPEEPQLCVLLLRRD